MSDRPSASATAFIVDAVPIELQGPADGALLLVACMHGGFRIMRVDAAGAADGEPAPARTLRHYERHASLAYGADWVQVRGGRGTGAGKGGAGAATVVSTCSFYDRSLHVWEARL